MEHFNKLSPPEAERLAILSEELGGAVQAVGKILRHGYESNNNGKIKTTNRITLMRELGHVNAAIRMMKKAGDIDRNTINYCSLQKSESVKQWLHHA